MSKALTCVFCWQDQGSLQALKDHCAVCPEHPLVKENTRLKQANELLHLIADKAYAVYHDAIPLEEAFNPYAYAVGEEEVDELRKEYEVAGERLVSLGVSLSDDAEDVVGEMMKHLEQRDAEIVRLRALISKAYAGDPAEFYAEGEAIGRERAEVLLRQERERARPA